MIDGSEKCICQLSFEFQNPYVNERGSKTNTSWGILLAKQEMEVRVNQAEMEAKT